MLLLICGDSETLRSVAAAAGTTAMAVGEVAAASATATASVANATASVATTGIMALATARNALQEVWTGIDLVNVTAEVATLRAAAHSPQALEQHWSSIGATNG